MHIYLNKSWYSHFATLKADGSIIAWGRSNYGGTGAPSDNGYTKIYSNFFAFVAVKAALIIGQLKKPQS
jgi:alpha-tubulin suppressor-like RCC1 family protein